MRAIIQRVNFANVKVESKVVGEIQKGLLLLLGIEDSDDDLDIEYLTSKISNVRIFNDSDGKMNLSVKDIDGDILIISQFTLFASTKKGNRPSYIRASKGYIAEPIYIRFCKIMENKIGKNIQKGIFGADMQVSLINDGPVTIIFDSKEKDY
jgi:D-tyrosyl-tRNA(Tyr) deacylase